MPNILSAVSWKDAAVGAGAVMVIGSVGRPLLVSALSTGISTWKEITAEAKKIKAEALAVEAKSKADNDTFQSILAEIKELRAQVTSISSKKPATANA